MIAWVAAKFNQWRINRYLARRRKDVPHAAALRAAWLKPEKALSILYQAAKGSLHYVGLIIYSPSDGFTSLVDQDQLALVLTSMADLTPVLSKTKQREVTEYLSNLSGHNWGYVRDAANAALQILRVTVPA